MATGKRKRPAKKATKRARPAAADTPISGEELPQQLREFLDNTAIPKGFVNSKKLTLPSLRERLAELNVRPTVPLERLLPTLNRIKTAPATEKQPEEIR